MAASLALTSIGDSDAEGMAGIGCDRACESRSISKSGFSMSGEKDGIGVSSHTHQPGSEMYTSGSIHSPPSLPPSEYGNGEGRQAEAESHDHFR